MKKILVILLAFTFMGVLGIPANSKATTYTFVPNPADIYDLDHNYFYTWGISSPESGNLASELAAGEKIVGASLFFDNIKSTVPNILYVHLLDTNFAGIISAYDGTLGGDDFSGIGVYLTQYSLPSWPPQDITYVFTAAQIAALTTYVADGKFGVGFDPDCHYFNDGIKLIVQTPEPSTMLLLGLGLLGLAVGGGRRFIK